MRRVPHLVLMILLGALVLACIWMARKYAAEREKFGLLPPIGDMGAPARQVAGEPRQADAPTGRTTADPMMARGDGTTKCPPGYPVKGKGTSKIYHLPGQRFYDVTVATQCFATAEAAEAAGYRASKR